MNGGLSRGGDTRGPQRSDLLSLSLLYNPHRLLMGTEEGC